MVACDRHLNEGWPMADGIDEQHDDRSVSCSCGSERRQQMHSCLHGLQHVDGIDGVDDVPTTGDHLERLANDQEIVAVLQSCDFRGPDWEEFVKELIAYAYQRLLYWIRSGQIFYQCQGKGIPLTAGHVRRMEGEDAKQLTEELLGDAVIRFEALLRQDSWCPDKGATLTTYFVGQCILCFPNRYRAWCRAGRPGSWESLSELDEDSARFSGAYRQVDPAEAAVAAADLQRMGRDLDKRTFNAIRLQHEGYQIAEIAELLNDSPKAIEMALYHHRRRIRGEGGTE